VSDGILKGEWHLVLMGRDRLLFGDEFTTKTDGGFTVYYVSPSKGGVTAFKPVGAHFQVSITEWILPLDRADNLARASVCSRVTPRVGRKPT